MKKLVVAVLGEGAIFGEMFLVGQVMHNNFAESIGDCTLYGMSRLDVERLIHHKPQVALRFKEAMALRLQTAATKLENLAFKGIPARLADLLIQLSQDSEDGYTHQNLAEMLGTFRKTTTQVLNGFKGDGWIKVGRKQIKIRETRGLDMVALE